MISKSIAISALLLAIVALIINKPTEAARYLPTRGNGDRIDKLRELLKEVSLI